MLVVSGHIDRYDRIDYTDGMIKQIPAVKARQQLGTLLDEVRFRGTDFIIERDGKPMAAVISTEAYARYRKMREQFFDSLEEVSDEIAGQVSQDELLAAIDEAAREVRKEQVKR